MCKPGQEDARAPACGEPEATSDAFELRVACVIVTAGVGCLARGVLPASCVCLSSEAAMDFRQPGYAGILTSRTAQ